MQKREFVMLTGEIITYQIFTMNMVLRNVFAIIKYCDMRDIKKLKQSCVSLSNEI